MTTARRLRGLAACLLAAGGSLLAASPAQAGTPTFTWHTPPKGATVTTVDVPFHLTVGMQSSEGRLVGNVDVTFAVPAGAEPVPGLSQRGDGLRSVDVTGTRAFRWNGSYTAHATARGRNNFLDNETNPRTDTATFLVDAPPAKPSDVTSSVDKDTRVVTVSWAPNAEPDLVGYEVQKEDPDGRWEHFVYTSEPSATDDSTAFAGGTYRYRVAALRRAADPQFANPSDFSTTSAQVPSPPPGTPPPPPGSGPSGGTGDGGEGAGSGTDQTGGSTGGGTDGSTAGGSTGGGRRSMPPLQSSGKVDLSDLDSLMAQAEKQRRAAGEDEGTFDPTLPFGARQDGGEEVEDDEEGSVLGLGESDDVAGRLQSLGFLAGGLLATVLAMHVLWIRSEVHKAEKAERLTPIAPEPRDEVSAEARFGLGEAPARRSRSRARPPAEVAAGVGPGQDTP